jgi:hypothetical protein
MPRRARAAFPCSRPAPTAPVRRAPSATIGASRSHHVHDVASDCAGPPPHFSLVPPPCTRRFEDAAGVSFRSFPCPPPSSSTLTTPTALRAREASQAPDTAPLPAGFEADIATPPSPVSHGSVPPRFNWNHALTPPFSPMQLLRTLKITGAAPPPEHRRPEPTPPPRRHVTASVRPRTVPPCPAPFPFPV